MITMQRFKQHRKLVVVGSLVSILILVLIVAQRLSSVEIPDVHIQPALPVDNGQCVVGLLSDASYLRMAEVLGYSLIKHHTDAKKIMMVIKGVNTPDITQRLESVNWQVRPVDLIPQPGEQANDARFRLMFTKLHIWNLLECRVAIYVDLDTIVVKNFDELFTVLPAGSNFAAVPDNFFGTYKFEINAGVFVCKPDYTEYQNLLVRAKDTTKYASGLAEQAFLSYHYRLSAVRLPFIYNANVAIFKHNRADWDEMKGHIKIIHYTLWKPGTGKEIKEEPAVYWYQVEKEMNQWLNVTTNS
jgi:lipopolysaccharide biosynthesis glycosyltransferase